MTQALDTIRCEHESLAKVLMCLRHLAEALQEGSRKPDFEILFAILDYLEGFPDTYHHPKEEEFLFKALRQRRPAAAPLLDKLHEEHAEGVALAAELRAALEAYRRDPSASHRFSSAAETYVDFERKHMDHEEREILPLALEALNDEDWQEINAAFALNHDPIGEQMFGVAREKKFDALLATILEFTREPAGPGTA